MGFILEIIGEIFIEVIGSWFFTTRESSYIGFTIKTLVRLSILFLIISVSYQFTITEAINQNFLIGISLFFTFIFLLLSFNSFKSLKNIKKDSQL